MLSKLPEIVKPEISARVSLAGAFAMGAALLAGCTGTTYRVKVDAVAKAGASAASQAQSYKIRNKTSVQPDDNLRHKEVTEYIKTALSGCGLYEAPTSDSADMIVELDFGITAPRTKVERVSVPVYAQVGGGVRYEQVPTTSRTGVTTTRTVAVYEPPRTELVGFDEVPREVTVYEKYLRITARDNKPAAEGKPPTQIWSVHSSTEDESKDLRKYLPIIASATVEMIGKDSSWAKEIKVRVPSPGVEFIKKGMNDESTAVAVRAPAPKI
jgi:hypothetical protein